MTQVPDIDELAERFTAAIPPLDALILTQTMSAYRSLQETFGGTAPGDGCHWTRQGCGGGRTPWLPAARG
jgi:hypothetical protein